MLLVITAASIAFAVVCAFYAWRISRAERFRSAARVSALANAIDGTAVAPIDVSSPMADAAENVAAPPRTAFAEWNEADRRSVSHEVARPVSMFDRDPHSVVQGRPLVKLAVGFAMAIAIIVVIAMTGKRHDASEIAAAAQPSAAPTATSGVADASRRRPGQEALELLSMRHDRSGNTLTVTGLVRNPGAAAADSIMAVVFAFDRNGGFVASGRAPLEFPTIAAGDESPFRVTVPDVKDVGRYRVSFRTTAGVLRHVDRREPAAGAKSTQIS
jgi:hypothetical protein